MANVYKVKEGGGEGRTDEGTAIEIELFMRRLGTRVCQYLGTEPPVFDSSNPTDYYRHIVIEIGESEINQRFHKAGFYVVADVDAMQSDFIYRDV